MSGIVGIINFDGKPVDPRLLRAMTDFMAFRGPDAQETWIGGNVGFGHTMLRTTWEAEHERQPCSLDGQVWITADARIDDRENLIDKLIAKGRHVVESGPDVELILHAYHVWGEDCVEHLLGDFAFAIWDARLQRVFCARDQLGVRPFYYFRSGGTFVFSNTLDCIRLHPAVSTKLNDLAIADFLLFDLNMDMATTSFADIQRLPPAHCASGSESALQLRRYWTLPIDEPIYFKRTSDYVDRFRELLHAAVGDRLRTNRVGIFMSGGIDSTTLAATACAVSRERSFNCEVRAFTSVFDRFDSERYYTRLVADRLEIPIHYRDGNHDLMDTNWERTSIHTSEPVCHPVNLTADRHYNHHLSSLSRVFFWGEGPDNALYYEWRPYLSYLINQRRWRHLMVDASRFATSQRRVPLLTTLPRIARDWYHRDLWEPFFPGWLNKNLESRLKLRLRWGETRATTPSSHPVRPTAYKSFNGPLWPGMFELHDAASTMAPIEVRQPFVDLRLLRYMLTVPVIPWCRAKYLVRRAMRGVLPEQVLRRPKSVLSEDPVMERVSQIGLPPIVPVAMLDKYVDLDHVPRPALDNQRTFWINFRPRSLNYWLKNLSQFPGSLTEEIPDEPIADAAG